MDVSGLSYGTIRQCLIITVRIQLCDAQKTVRLFKYSTLRRRFESLLTISYILAGITHWSWNMMQTDREISN